MNNLKLIPDGEYQVQFETDDGYGQKSYDVSIVIEDGEAFCTAFGMHDITEMEFDTVLDIEDELVFELIEAQYPKLQLLVPESQTEADKYFSAYKE